MCVYCTFMCRRMCVWLICRDVKLRRLFVFCFCRGHAAIMQTHANEAMHDGGSRGWSPWCTCIVVTTCCSGFASIQSSMSGDGKRLNPRTSKSILFLHGCHNLYFRRNHVADVFWLFRRDHVAVVPVIIVRIHCRTLSFGFSTCWSNFGDSGLNSVWQHWMLYIVFEKYFKGLFLNLKI